MSLETYKQLNEELIKKVQAQKIFIGVLQNEAVQANTNFFNEHQKRIEEKETFLQIINEIKTSLGLTIEKALLEVQTNGFLEYVEEEAVQIDNDLQLRLSLAEVRRRSSGVTVRSPLRTISPQDAERAATSEEMPSTDENEQTSSNGVVYETINLGKITESTENSDNINLAENNDKTVSELTSNSDEINENQEKSSDFRKKETFEIPEIRIDSKRDTRENTSTVLRQISQNITSCTTNITQISVADNSMEHLTINFDEQLCLHSTPRSTIDLTVNEETTTIAKSISGENDTLTSSRPRRRCTPIVLTEPSLQGKLRNEEQVKKRQKQKKKR